MLALDAPTVVATTGAALLLIAARALDPATIGAGLPARSRPDLDYDPLFDAFTCPCGTPLWLVSVDEARGVRRYAAEAGACRSCPLGRACPARRHSLDRPTVQLQAGRDYARAVLAVVLLELAAGLALVAALLTPRPSTAVAAAAVFAAITLHTIPLGRRVRQATRARAAGLDHGELRSSVATPTGR
jgi:hypothetical protein